jgi:hypothetical protein
MSAQITLGYKAGVPPSRGSALGQAYDSISEEDEIVKLFAGQIVLVSGFDQKPGSTLIYVLAAKVQYTPGMPFPECYTLNPKKQTVAVIALELSSDGKTAFLPATGYVPVRKESIVSVSDCQGKTIEEMMLQITTLKFAWHDAKKQLKAPPTISIVDNTSYDGCNVVYTYTHPTYPHTPLNIFAQ